MMTISWLPLIVLASAAAASWATPQRHRWIPPLAASLWLYRRWDAGHLILLVALTGITYLAALGMAGTRELRGRRLFLGLGLVAGLGALVFFKYAGFLNESWRSALGAFGLPYGGAALGILLPVGLSFYTFRILAYLFDVYRGRETAERHAGRFALYVSFFPQMVSGPIERPERLLPQIARGPGFDYLRVKEGAKLVLWGLFKKLVVADRLAFFVNAVFDRPEGYSGAPVVLAAYLFAVQIYADFSGYTDMAIGGAMILGYETEANFHRPYFAPSLPEFWRRWHISLTSWFRDYVYIPLGGNRVSPWRWRLNILAVFILSGLWHGAAWTFVAWGGLHAVYYLASAATAGRRRRLAQRLGFGRVPGFHHALRIFITFSLVSLAWIFFRASSLSRALLMLRHLRGGLPGTVSGMSPFVTVEWLSILLAIAFAAWTEHLRGEGRGIFFPADRPLWLRWAVYYTVIFGLLAFGVVSRESFIYAQF